MSGKEARTVGGMPFGTVIGVGLVLTAMVLALRGRYIAAAAMAVIGGLVLWVTNSTSKALAEWSDHAPPAPHGLPVEVWAYGDPVELTGQFTRPSAIRALLGHLSEFTTPAGAERTDMHAALVADPMNPHDSNAVAIYMDGHHVGYLPAEQGPHYASHVLQAQGRSTYYTVRASIWGVARRLSSGEETAGGRLRLYLPAPDGLLPSNAMPTEPHVVLPTGHRVVVAETDHHMEVLQAHVTPGGSRPVAVVLRSGPDQPGGEQQVHVELDGQPVGVLTRERSDDILPLVRRLEGEGRLPVARASVHDLESTVQVVLDVAQAGDDLAPWLAEVDRRVEAERLRPEQIPAEE